MAAGTVATITTGEAIDLARTVNRVLVVGAPGSGKTTLTKAIGRPDTLHTDDVMHVPWELQRQAVVDWAQARGDRWLIEGVTAARCLRHGQLDMDLVLWLPVIYGPRGPRAVLLGKAVTRWVDEAIKPIADRVRYVVGRHPEAR